MRRALAAAIVVALAVAGLAGCKRQKPPARARVWVGPHHACALQKSGELECWGKNDASQLGDRTTENHALPASAVKPGALDELAIGDSHTCALSAGGVQCWGAGARGQLGTGLTTSLSAASVPVIAKGAPLSAVKAIDAYGDRTCAATPDGVRCWGDGKPEAEETGGFLLHGNATAIAVGSGFACASFTDPLQVHCAGVDSVGQSAGHEAILRGATIVNLTAGESHACALLEDGSIQCWGSNAKGQLGDGTTTDSRVPALVHGLPPAAEVRAGANHTCARLRTNTVACWGDNAAHQLANGTSKPSSKPAPIPGLVGVVELALAGDLGCARLTAGDVRCWGANTFGQLGDGTTVNHDVPMPVKSAPKKK
ncbi:MAG: repeat domain protein [Labilithrix sp.]|nr:repeat domain protein [Labilithrix sp.]